jgi:ParB family chromosome partitioning protein
MTKKKHTGLGKGLDALLPSAVEFTDKGIKFKTPDDEKIVGEFPMIELSKIVYNPYQPRKKFDEKELENLKNSIIENGVIQPISVRKALNGYELIAGERRVRAAMLAGLKKIPAIIQDIDTDQKMLELALLENIMRSDLNPIETANAFDLLIQDHDLTQEEIAKKMGMDRATVANYLRLLKLPIPVQDELCKGITTMGHAKAILGLGEKKRMLKAWTIVKKRSLTVRETEKLVRDIELGLITLSGKTVKKNIKSVRKDNSIPADLKAVIEDKEQQLRYKFGVKVRINAKDDVSGSIEFNYVTIDDFDRIMELLLSDKKVKNSK